MRVAVACLSIIVASSCVECGPALAPLVIEPSSIPVATINANYDVTFTVTDGTAPVTFLLTSGDLPTGLTLTVEGRLSGVPLTAASSNFTVRARDAKGRVGTATYELTVSPPAITVAPAMLVDALRGAAYLAQLSASGGTGPYLYSLSSGTLPDGITLNTTGALSGRATAVGTSNFVVRATDSLSRVGESQIRLVVTEPMVSFTPAMFGNGTIGLNYDVSLVGTGGTEPYTFALESGALPAGLSLSSGGGIGGRPTTAGTSDFVLRVTDVNGVTATSMRSITVVAQAITIGPDALTSVTVGVPFTQTLTASGGSGPWTFAVTTGTLPPGVTLSLGGVLGGRPMSIGTTQLTITATDRNMLRGSRSYSLVITPAVVTLNPPALPSVIVGGSYSQQLAASGGSGPYIYNLTSGALPAGLSLSAAGLISGTATTQQLASFSVTAVDIFNSSATVLYRIAVSNTQIAVTPTTLPDGRVSGAYSQQLSASGGVAPYTYTIFSGALPDGLSLSSTGLISGTPTVETLSTFTVLASDGIFITGQRTYTLDVPPLIIISPASLPFATVGVPYSQQLTTTGQIGSVTFSLQNGTLPAGISFSATGLISGTPTSTTGSSFTIIASDTSSQSGTRAFTLSISSADGGFGGDGTCASPFAGVALPFTTTNTTGAIGDGESRCTSNSGRGQTYRIEFSGGTRFTAKATANGPGIFPSLSLLRGACGTQTFVSGCTIAASLMDPATLVIDDLAPGTYFLVVAGAVTSVGDYELQVTASTPTPDPLASSCTSPATLTTTAGIVELEATTLGADDDGSPGGTLTATGTPDRNYRYTAPNAQTAVAFTAWTLNENRGGVALCVLDDCSPDAGGRFVAEGGHFGSARITAVLNANQTVFPWVDTLAPSTTPNPFHLRVREAPIAATTVGECSATSSPLMAPNTSYSGTTLGLTSHFGGPATFLGGQCGSSVRYDAADFTYRYTAPSNGIVTFRIEPEAGTRYAMVVLTSCSPSQCLANSSEFAIAEPGTPHEVQVGVTAGLTIFLVLDAPDLAIGKSDMGGYVISASQP